MKFLVFVGPRDTGKTTLVGKLTHYFNDNLGYSEYPEGNISDELKLRDKKSNGFQCGFSSSGNDSYIVLEKNGKYVLFYSPSDVMMFINRLINILDILNEKGIEISLVVTSSRDASDYLYEFTTRTLKFNNENSIEIPLGRMIRGPRREQAMNHYISSIHDLVTKRILPSILLEENLL